eukprot:7942559-Pyramimonas_sp.AAC.1
MLPPDRPANCGYHPPRGPAFSRKSADLAGVSSLRRPTRMPEAGRRVAESPAASAQRWHARAARAPGSAGGDLVDSASSSSAPQPRAGSSWTSMPA